MRPGLGIGAAVILAVGGCAGKFANDTYVNDQLNGLEKKSGTGTGAPVPVGTAPAEAPLPAGVVRVKGEDDTFRCDAAGIAREMIRRWADIRDYTCQMEKQEWIGGGVEATPHCIMEYVRLSPKSMHYCWVGEVNKGRHAVWVDGANEGRMLVHPNPIFGFGTMKISPDSPFAKTESNYDFRRGGLQGVMVELPDTLRENGTVWTYVGEGSVYGRPVWRLTGVDPTPDPTKHNLMELHVDQETYLPLFFQGKTKEGRLNVWVKFRDVRTNVGLTDADFNPAKIW